MFLVICRKPLCHHNASLNGKSKSSWKVFSRKKRVKDVRWHPKLGHVVRQEVKSRDDGYVSLFCKIYYVGEDGGFG